MGTRTIFRKSTAKISNQAPYNRSNKQPSDNGGSMLHPHKRADTAGLEAADFRFHSKEHSQHDLFKEPKEPTLLHAGVLNNDIKRC